MSSSLYPSFSTAFPSRSGRAAGSQVFIDKSLLYYNAVFAYLSTVCETYPGLFSRSNYLLSNNDAFRQKKFQLLQDAYSYISHLDLEILSDNLLESFLFLPSSESWLCFETSMPAFRTLGIKMIFRSEQDWGTRGNTAMQIKEPGLTVRAPFFISSVFRNISSCRRLSDHRPSRWGG